MGGQVQQPNTASHYDHHGSMFPGAQNSDAADAALTRWLQSAGLQHLASPTVAHPALDPRLLPNILMQDYPRHGGQSFEDRQKLFRLLKSISGGMDASAEQPFTPPPYGSGRHNGMDGLSSPELRGEIGGGILDLHSMDDIELLSEDAVHEPFEASPFGVHSEKGYGNEPDVLWSSNKPLAGKQRMSDESSPMRAASYEKETTGKDSASGVARIKVVVRKRPLNKKEIARKEDDIVTVDGSGCSLTVHEPKLKVDLTAYVEKHDFVFDAVLDDQVSNDEVYRVTVEPIIPCIFQRTKATCFAYGQTGSGKTFTMQPLPLRACQDILILMQHPSNRGQGLQLWLSFFEIYGGKLYDLLNERRKLMMREDGRQQVCIVGLKEFPVSDVELVKDYIEKGNGARSIGSTGANEESSRSHAILQLVIKKHSAKKEERGGKLVGKFSFIDLAGSERGADTTDNDRQTRIEGAEINKSLLALKECIRALDHEQGHIPFRGSKLTEVLRDSFVGDSRTVMISCISPNTGSCEHTINTLRYADRVKGLSKSGNNKRDPSPSTGVQTQKDSTSLVSQEASDSIKEYRVPEASKRPVEFVNMFAQPGEQDGWSAMSSNVGPTIKENMKSASFSNEKERGVYRDSLSNSFNYQRDPIGERNEQEKVSPPRRKAAKDDRAVDRFGAWVSNEEPKSEKSMQMPRKSSFKEEPMVNNVSWRARDAHEAFTPPNAYDGHISAILEEEEDLIAAHRLEVEDTMELVCEEMKLLSEVDHPGSRIDRYISQLSYILSRKAAGIVNLQARLARFQRHLQEQEIISHMSSGE